MKIRRLERRSKYQAQRISITGANADTLSLILVHAKENIERELIEKPNSPTDRVKHDLLKVIHQMSEFINADDPWARSEDEFKD